MVSLMLSSLSVMPRSISAVQPCEGRTVGVCAGPGLGIDGRQRAAAPCFRAAARWSLPPAWRGFGGAGWRRRARAGSGRGGSAAGPGGISGDYDVPGPLRASGAVFGRRPLVSGAGAGASSGSSWEVTFSTSSANLR